MGRTNGSRPWILPVQSQLPYERADDSPDGSGHTHHRRCRPNRNSHRCQGPAQEVALQRTGPRRRRAQQQERIDATINFRGKFRKHNKDKADGTLEVTLEGGATYLDLDVSGTEPIVTEQPIPPPRSRVARRRSLLISNPRTATASRTSTSSACARRIGRRYTRSSSAFRF